MKRRLIPLLGALALALGACGDDGADRPTVRELPAPLAAGTSAANIELDSGYEFVMVRWVARSTGLLEALHLRIQADGAECRQSGKSHYGAGNGGRWLVTTHPVLDDGRPEMERTLATHQFRPCDEPREVVDVEQGVVRVRMGFPAVRGDEYATVVRNDDPDPGANYTSTNFLFTQKGILGANGRNERSPGAADAYYGLDARELVGYTNDAGRRWLLPGGPYPEPSGRNFLPTYLQEYADGRIVGQPFYYASAPQTERAMLFRNGRRRWVIRGLGAYTETRRSGTLTLTVAGRQRARVRVTGPGMVRAPIEPVTVPPGATVRVAASGIEIRDVVADTAWGRLVGMHLPGAPWRIEGGENFSAAAPVYPLPPPPSATP